MAVRFIIGRAGTGKTHHCVQAIRERLAADPLNGPRLLFLVPEQAGLQMERTLVVPDESGREGVAVEAAHRVDVLSFDRLAQRVLEIGGPTSEGTLSEPARGMVVRHLLSVLGPRLRYYFRVSRLGGVAQRLAATVAELMEECVQPEDIPSVSVQDDPLRHVKLHDLSLLYRAYLDFLGAQRSDPSQRLEVARRNLTRCPWVQGAELWVDGFASFSRQELHLLCDLIRRCRTAEITMLMDPALAATEHDTRGFDPVTRLFLRPHRTYRELWRACTDDGIPVEPPIVLDAVRPRRFSPSDALAALERGLFLDKAPVPSAEALPPPRVEIVRLSTRRAEVDFAAARILQWIRGPGAYRFRDIAVITRDLEPYHDVVSAVFRTQGIPFFLDRRRSMAHHPLLGLIRAAAALGAESLSIDSVRSVLKTGLLPFSADESDELENAVLERGLAGLAAWRDAEWTTVSWTGHGRPRARATPNEDVALARLNELRRRFMAAVEPWIFFSQKGRTCLGPEWAEGVRQLLCKLRAAQTLARWSADAEHDGDLDLAESHRQVWRDTISFLDDLAFAFSDTKFDVDEFVEVLDTGLAALSVGLAPPMLDQVLVGAIDRTRHPEVKAAIIFGFNEGSFPSRPVEESILNDDDRAALCNAGVAVRPPSRERLCDEAILVYTAVTRPSETLLITFAASDEEGKPLRPSPFVQDVCRACPGLKPRDAPDVERARDLSCVTSIHDLACRLASEFRTRPMLTQDDPKRRGRWNALYENYRTRLAADPVAKGALQSLASPVEARLSASIASGVYSLPLKTSVSRLESYATCPFQHFARHTLRLVERPLAELAAVDVGELHHAVLEDFVGGLAGRRTGVERLTEEEVSQLVQDSWMRVAARLPAQGRITLSRDRYTVQRMAQRIARIVQAQRRIGQRGRAKPQAVELPFGTDEPDSLPALELTTPAGRGVLLRGYIDRVDWVEYGKELLGVVLDYKHTRHKRFDWSAVHYGHSLQLLSYLLVITAHGRTLAGRRVDLTSSPTSVRPLAALYVGLAPTYEVVAHPDEVTPRDRTFPPTFRPSGVIASELVDWLDDPSAGGGWSPYYRIYRKADGELGNLERSDAVAGDSLNHLLNHTKRKLGELADGVLDGDIAARPYRLGGFSPCSWCEMRSVCRFELGLCCARFLEPLSRAEVLARCDQPPTVEIGGDERLMVTENE